MRRLAGHIVLWVFPLLVLLGAEYRHPGLLTTPPWFAYLALVTLVGSTGMAFAVSVVGRRHYGEVAIGLSLQAAGLIALFAFFYRDIGLIVPGGGPLALHDALYFSMVTWTTLGYGDFQPAAASRLLAATEAMLGYVYLGVIVGLFSRAIR